MAIYFRLMFIFESKRWFNKTRGCQLLVGFLELYVSYFEINKRCMLSFMFFSLLFFFLFFSVSTLFCCWTISLLLYSNPADYHCISIWMGLCQEPTIPHYGAFIIPRHTEVCAMHHTKVYRWTIHRYRSILHYALFICDSIALLKNLEYTHSSI